MEHKSIIEKHQVGVVQNGTDNGEYVELVHSGEDYFLRLKEIINKAKKEIHLQTYIFENDETGKAGFKP